MAPPTVYGMYGSTCVKRVLTTMLEKGVTEFKLVPINLATGEHKKPEFLALQPFGIIPVYEDEDVRVYESRAIARHVGTKFASQGNTELFGTTLKEKALVDQWLEVEHGTYNAVCAPIVAERVFKPRFGGTTDEARVAELKKKFEPILDIYEKHLASSEYLAGDKFTMADLSHLPYTALLFPAGEGELITSRPHLAKWWEKISARESWKKVCEMK